MRERTVRVRYGEKTFVIDGESTIADFLRSQKLDQLRMIVLRKVDGCLVFHA